jgi:spoIIIJ-associated protein
VLDEEAVLAREAIADILNHMDIDASITIDPTNVEDPDAPWILDVRGQNLGGLIGKGGSTLDALQYITRLIVSRQLQRRVDVVVDVAGYKERRAESLRKLAERMARQATKMNRTVTLEPMPPNERRIIHMTLRSNNDVTTESVGQGNRRRVTIVPQ